jgi:hypothetical protein
LFGRAVRGITMMARLSLTSRIVRSLFKILPSLRGPISYARVLSFALSLLLSPLLSSSFDSLDEESSLCGIGTPPHSSSSSLFLLS